MKRKWKKVWAAVLTSSILMGNLAYAAPAQKKDSAISESSVEQVLSDSLVMHSTFDSDAVTAEKVQDVTGRGNDGTIVGNVTYVDGIRGSAVWIDNGSSAGGDSKKAVQYINYGQTADLKFGTEDFSISFWMKTENHGSNNSAILSNKNYANGSNVGWAFGNFNNASDKDLRMNFSAAQESRVELKRVPANDDSWHHVVGTYDRDGDMCLYLDGALYSSASMKGHVGKTVDVGLDFILGADGRGNNGLKDCAVDELRVYKKVLEKEAVEMLYTAEGAKLIADEMAKQLGKVEANGEYTQEAIDQLAEEIEKTKNTLDGMTAAAAMAAVAALQKAYDAFMKGTEPLASFQVVSDVHIKSDSLTETNAVNFIAGLQDMASLDPESIGIMNLGDFTQSGTEAQYDAMYQIMEQYSPVSDDKVMITLGNHDVRGTSSAQWNRDENVESSYWQTAKKLYLENNAKYMPNNGETLYFDRWLGGYHFIVLNTENGLKDAMYLSPEQLKWLEETLAENASPDKPIFVMGHNALNDTHWRSNILNGFGNQDSQVKEIFKKYPQVIYMSGHIHNGFGTVEAIDREFGTMIDLPSYNDSENGVTETGTGYHVKIYEDRVVFRARNFKTSSWMPEYDITVPLPGLPAVYKQAEELNEVDYTAASYQNVANVMAEAKTLFDTKYVQTMNWDEVEAPAESLFTGKVREQISKLTAELQSAMDGLVSSSQALTPVQDVYLQGGSDAAKKPSAYSNYDKTKLRVKFSDGQQNYTRRALMTFDISSLDDSIKEVNLVLQLTLGITNTNPAKDFTSADVFQVANTWKSDSVTWNTKPERIGSEPAAVITKAEVSGEFVTVDVTKAVTDAISRKEQQISFEISCPTEANDNMIDFYSTRAAGKQAPTLTAKTAVTEKPMDPKFQELREKWVENRLGGKLNLENEAVKTYIANQDKKAGEYWSSMRKSSDTSRKNLWDDLDMSYIAGTGAAAKEHSGNVATTFYRLKDMAIAWATEGCELYQNEELKKELILALDFMNENHYSSSDSKTPFFGNWWHWEIGAPIAFMDTALILYDELTLKQIQNYAAAVNRFTDVCNKPSGYPGSPAMTGANLIDKGMAVTQVGILTDRGDKLEHVKGAYKSVFTYVTTGDGFYKDGSFIQHQALAYMGGYGSSLYEKLSVLFSVLAGTDYELTYDDHAEQLIFDMVFEGIEPFLYDGLCMDMVSGRDITRKTSNDKNRGAGIMDSMMLLGDAMPKEQQERFNSMMKYYIGIDEAFYYERSTRIASLMKANRIMEDDSIQPRSEYALHKLFASMDKLVHITGQYGFALSMHSSRTYGHELINDEGKQTWNISDGMTYLYNGDREQYAEGYWATVDPKRLAGTTTEYVTRANGAGDRTKNIYSWVGGSSLSNYGTAGMHFKTLGNSGSTRNGTDAKKSWFMFDDEIVAVGSGITSSTGNYVETVVENRKLKKDGSNAVIADGTAVNIRDDGAESAEKGTLLQQTSWMHLEGNTEDSDIGYYFPGKADIMALKEKRTGNWSAQGTTEGEETNQFATFWFEHGKKPSNAQYSYVILPGKGVGETEQYAAAPDVEVLECSEDAHAVRENTLGITAVNFWNNKEKTAAGITSDRASSVTMQTEGDILTVGVSDPTQEYQGEIHISLPYVGGEIVAKDANVEVTQTTPFIKLAVNTKGCVGSTSTLSIHVEKAAQCEIIGLAEELEKVTVDLGTKFAELPLPKTIAVYDNEGKTQTVEISWERGDYNKDLCAEYELFGTLVLPEGLYNTSGIKAVILVQVGQDMVKGVDDAYVQGGTDSNKNFGGSSGLIVKNDQGAQNYTRKAIMKFDITQIPEDIKTVYLTFQLKGTPSADFTSANVYHVENGWTGNTVTFGNFPARIGNDAVASFTKADTAKSLVQKLDVSSAVAAARAKGETEISFEVSIPAAAKNNYMEIHSIRSTSEDAVKPSLTWDVDYTPEKIIKKNLSFVVEMAKSVDADAFANVNETYLNQLIDEAEAVLADEDASMDEIHEMERVLTQEMAKYRRN